jgi:hypothetical protein
VRAGQRSSGEQDSDPESRHVDDDVPSFGVESTSPSSVAAAHGTR